MGSRQANPLAPLNLISDQALRDSETGEVISDTTTVRLHDCGDGGVGIVGAALFRRGGNDLANDPGTLAGGGGGGSDGPVDVVVTAKREGQSVADRVKKKTDWKQCLLAVVAEAAEGFIDPLAILYGYGSAVHEARNRIAPEDYGKPENRYTFKRSIGQAAKLGLRRFIPGYLQASIIGGGVRATFEVFRNPACGVSD